MPLNPHSPQPEFQVEHKERRVLFLNVSISEEELLRSFFGPKPCKNSFQVLHVLPHDLELGLYLA